MKIKKRVIAKCKNCQKEFEFVFCSKRKFCSMKCKGLFYSGKNNPHYGIPQLDYVKRIVSKSNKGRITPGFIGHKHSEISKNKIAINTKIALSNSTKKRKPNTFWIGRKHKEESKKKISEIRKKLFLEGRIKPNVGMLGKHHSEEVKKRFSILFKGRKSYMAGKKHSQETIQKMKELRKNRITPIKDTSIEIKIQSYLKQLNIDFFTHQYVKIKHGYQCDFFIPSMNMIIETDGNYWHKFPIGNEIDHIRTKELIEKGFKVLRLWESEIKIMDLNKFKEKLKNVA